MCEKNWIKAIFTETSFGWTPLKMYKYKFSNIRTQSQII